jgi:hypothetical protein
MHQQLNLPRGIQAAPHALTVLVGHVEVHHRYVVQGVDHHL